MPGLSALERAGYWLSRIQYWTFAGLIGLAVMLHVGFRWPWSPDAPFLGVVDAWPGGSGWDTSVGWLAPAWLGLARGPLWAIFWLTVLIAVVATVAIRAKVVLPDPYSRVLLLCLAASAIPMRLSGWIGFYDELFLVGALLLALLGPRTWWIGAVITATANAEMAFVAGAATLFVGYGMRQRWVTVRGLAVMISASLVMAFVLIIRLVGEHGSGEDRLSLFIRNATRSLTLNFEWFPITTASMYLGTWIVVVLIVLTPDTTRRRLAIATGLVLLPLLFTILTLDGSRVAVCVSSVPLVLAIRTWLDRWASTQSPPNREAGLNIAIATLMVLAVLTPAVSVLAYSPSADWVAPWGGVTQLRDALTH